MEFLTYLVELLQNNPAEFFTTILSYSNNRCFELQFEIVKAVAAIINKIVAKPKNNIK